MSDLVTALIPTSVSPLHPDTGQIEQCVESIRSQPVIGNCRIVIMCDGVYPQQAHRADPYAEYVNRVRRLAADQWANVDLMVHPQHLHQVEMTRMGLATVDTPLLFYVEHDWVIRPRVEPGIDWDAATAAVLSGDINVLRFLYPNLIGDYWQHMMLDPAPVTVTGGCRVIGTAQWSQNPHLAAVRFYRWMFARHLRRRTTGMIEDAVHGVCSTAATNPTTPGWKVAIYAAGWPDRMSQCDHLDGRQGEEPYRPDWSQT